MKIRELLSRQLLLEPVFHLRQTFNDLRTFSTFVNWNFRQDELKVQLIRTLLTQRFRPFSVLSSRKCVTITRAPPFSSFFVERLLFWLTFFSNFRVSAEILRRFGTKIVAFSKRRQTRLKIMKGKTSDPIWTYWNGLMWHVFTLKFTSIFNQILYRPIFFFW